MPRPQALVAKPRSTFENLVQRVADEFPECDYIREVDLPPLSGPDIATVILHDTGAFERDELTEEADILGTDISDDAQHEALGRYRRAFLNREARQVLAYEVNNELAMRETIPSTQEEFA